MNTFNDSEECGISELDLFTVPPTQVAVEEGVWDDIKPHPNFEQGTIQFDIPGDSVNYLSLAETELWVKIRLLEKTDGGETRDVKFTPDINIFPVNNLLHSLFSQCQVYLNNKQVENTNSNYAYKAYLNNLLCYGKESKETFLENELFIKDDSENIDCFALFPYKTTPDAVTTITPDNLNEALRKRYNKFKTSQPVQLKGRLHCDIFNINRYLLSNVTVQIKLKRNKPEFYLIGLSDKYLIKIDECFLRVRRVRISPSVMLNHAVQLEKTTAKYPIKRALVKEITLPYSASKVSINGIHTGLMPRRVVLGFLKNTDYSGTISSNPFYFRNYNITKLELKISSRSLPYSSGLELNFDNNCYMQGYNTLFQGIREAPNDITYKDYKKGYSLFAFDLSPDLCSSEHFNIFKDGSLSLDIDFKGAITESITAVFYLEFDNIIEITKQRNIVVDYTV